MSSRNQLPEEPWSGDALRQSRQFLDDLRRSRQPLHMVAADRFSDKRYPYDYACGLVIGAGLTRCECGTWGKIKYLERNGIPAPCPHVQYSTLL